MRQAVYRELQHPSINFHHKWDSIQRSCFDLTSDESWYEGAVIPGTPRVKHPSNTITTVALAKIKWTMPFPRKIFIQRVKYWKLLHSFLLSDVSSNGLFCVLVEPERKMNHNAWNVCYIWQVPPPIFYIKCNINILLKNMEYIPNKGYGICEDFLFRLCSNYVNCNSVIID